MAASLKVSEDCMLHKDGNDRKGSRNNSCLASLTIFNVAGDDGTYLKPLSDYEYSRKHGLKMPYKISNNYPNDADAATNGGDCDYFQPLDDNEYLHKVGLKKLHKISNLGANNTDTIKNDSDYFQPLSDFEHSRKTSQSSTKQLPDALVCENKPHKPFLFYFDSSDSTETATEHFVSTNEIRNTEERDMSKGGSVFCGGENPSQEDAYLQTLSDYEYSRKADSRTNQSYKTDFIINHSKEKEAVNSNKARTAFIGYCDSVSILILSKL